MSKAKLRKEIATFTKEQLVEVVIDAYESSPEAKKYFEYFLNPDPAKLREEKENIVAKELNRTKWGDCKARISVIKRAVKEFRAFKGDAENHVLLLRDILMMMLGQNNYYNYPEALYNGAAYIAVEYIRVKAETDGIDEALREFDKIVNKLARPRMANVVRMAVKEFCTSVNTIKPE